MGAALGVFAGALPALAFTAADPSLLVAVPWLYLLALAVGLPLLAGAGAWLLTSKRVSREREVLA
ncbi:MAG: hypothetical protein M3P40_06740 [Actinomycetota bacterium]|nr:hypothetical protein [Actinomycetota bacterium]